MVLQRSCRFLRISPGPPDLWALPLEPKTFRSCRWSTRAAATCLVSGTWSSKNRHVKQNFNVFSFIFEIAATKNASFRNGKLPKFFFLFSQIDGGLPCYQPSVALHKLSCLAGGIECVPICEGKNTYLTLVCPQRLPGWCRSTWYSRGTFCSTSRLAESRRWDTVSYPSFEHLQMGEKTHCYVELRGG